MKKIIISLLFSLLPGLVYAEDVSVEPASIERVIVKSGVYG